jgi:hypothetical protein
LVRTKDLHTLYTRIGKERRKHIKTLRIPLHTPDKAIWIQRGRWYAGGPSAGGLWFAPLSVLQQFVGIKRVVLIEGPGFCNLQEISQWLATLSNAGNYMAEDRGGVQVIVELG